MTSQVRPRPGTFAKKQKERSQASKKPRGNKEGESTTTNPSYTHQSPEAVIKAQDDTGLQHDLSSAVMTGEHGHQTANTMTEANHTPLDMCHQIPPPRMMGSNHVLSMPPPPAPALAPQGPMSFLSPGQSQMEVPSPPRFTRPYSEAGPSDCLAPSIPPNFWMRTPERIPEQYEEYRSLPPGDPSLTFDTSLNEFIKTMEQSESEWANFMQTVDPSSSLAQGETVRVPSPRHSQIEDHHSSHTRNSSHHEVPRHPPSTTSQDQEDRYRDMDSGQRDHYPGDRPVMTAPSSAGVDSSDSQRKDDQGPLPPGALSTLQSQSHVTSSLAKTSLPSWIWAHVPVLIDVS